LKIGFGILGFPRFRYFSGSKRLKLPECVAISVELVCRAKHAVHGKCQDLFQELSIFDPKPSNALACCKLEKTRMTDAVEKSAV
jgi:hypothetical protein